MKPLLRSKHGINDAMALWIKNLPPYSVIEKLLLISPFKRGTRYLFFCSCVPNLASTSMLPVSGAEQLVACGARIIE